MFMVMGSEDFALGTMSASPSEYDLLQMECSVVT